MLSPWPELLTFLENNTSMKWAKIQHSSHTYLATKNFLESASVSCVKVSDLYILWLCYYFF